MVVAYAEDRGLRNTRSGKKPPFDVGQDRIGSGAVGVWPPGFVPARSPPSTWGRTASGAGLSGF